MKQLTDRLEQEAEKQKQTENQNATGTVLSLTKDGLKTIIEIEGDDPYKVIERLKKETPNKITPFAIMVSCSGWASPIDSTNQNTPPSQHPERVRVHIATAKTMTATASAITFADNRDNQTTDEGKGELVDALDRALQHLNRKHKTHIQRTAPKA